MTATPQSNATLADIARELTARDNFVICGHVSPDGDCIGSTLALAHALKALGKRVSWVLAEEGPIDATLGFLPGADRYVAARDYDGPVDTFVAVDVPTIERIGDAAALHDAASFTVTVDHHAVDTRMADASYTDPDAASTTMLVWELVGLLGVDRAGLIAQCAYTGLATDTGGFRFQNADAAAFRAAAEMVDLGACPDIVANEVFQNRALASYRLEALAIERAEFLGEAQDIVLSWLSADDFERFGAQKADAEPIVTTLRSIRGARVACVLREQGEVVRGSLRSKDGTDVARIARMFGGGGHTAAAGLTIAEPLDAALDEMRAVLAREIGGRS